MMRRPTGRSCARAIGKQKSRLISVYLTLLADLGSPILPRPRNGVRLRGDGNTYITSRRYARFSLPAQARSPGCKEGIERVLSLQPRCRWTRFIDQIRKKFSSLLPPVPLRLAEEVERKPTPLTLTKGWHETSAQKGRIIHVLILLGYMQPVEWTSRSWDKSQGVLVHVVAAVDSEREGEETKFSSSSGDGRSTFLRTYYILIYGSSIA
ncbi:hypothetical protein ASPZODRAFT_519416 [Penicilliopsis zonata CBS 506.65]|uniref:Uncharacterized protein n=1 Tax=Penicilliopsis zonata CBS 506.65 TaxID=1073090 RepID=A0A1L9SEY7_9EURO|nr:hypothetical protein ASPZODRAFT_519416 [Penicilliopsis zonata CBS 506.65]OJJ45739.1 hypothetical protein ASPZODRAFT_519416 [Penicilliopsis zonata CBS 506.65]